MTIDPIDSDKYIVGTWGGGVQISSDAGLTWTQANGIPYATKINRINIDPENSDVIFAINEGGNIYRSDNGGVRFYNRYINNGTLYDLEFKPGDSDVIYASGQNTVLKSIDNGITFENVDGPWFCLLYTSPSPRDLSTSRMPSSA